MNLTKNVILKEIYNKNIVITHFKKENLGPASYDITLANQIRVFKNSSENTPYPIDNNANYKEITERLEIKDQYVLQPGEMVLGITQEEIHLPNNICAWIQGRSCFARLGLIVHITASFVQPGIKNKQVFEILNTNTRPLLLIPGVRIGQLIFQRCEGEATYQGKFNQQEL
jgi:dCTP deaminase